MDPPTEGYGEPDHVDGKLAEALGQIPDPRSAQGRRHPLSALLTLTTVVMLAGARSLEGIAA